MSGDAVTFGFPLRVTEGGIDASRGDDALRTKIVQVLLTSPGERVNLPEFGCGLLNLVFEPVDDVFTAALEFTIGQALTRWLRDDLVVDDVDVATDGDTVTVEVAYTPRTDLTPQTLRIGFR